MKKILITICSLLTTLTLVFGQQNYVPNVTVSTLAGATTSGSTDGQGRLARFNKPIGVAVDGIGNVYVADINNNEIRKITAGGLVSTLAGSTADGYVDDQGSFARFYNPQGVSLDDKGNVYVADTWNHKIRKITQGGLVSTIAGSRYSGYANGQGGLASFYKPGGVAVDGNGNVYVVDSWNNTIRKITPDGLVSTLAGSTIQGSADGQGSLARFNYPQGIAVDSIGNVYVADYGNNMIRKITPSGLVSTLAGSTTKGFDDGQGSLAKFYLPAGIAVDGIGNVYVGDYGNNLIRKITADGLVSTLAGSTTKGSTDGQGSLARFYSPCGVALDGIGNIYVADKDNNLIRKITIGQTAGIVNDFNSSFINIYPNPAQNTLNVALSEDVNGTISLVDMQGNTVLSQIINGKTSLLNTSNIANGVYVLKVLSENASYIKQVIISK